MAGTTIIVTAICEIFVRAICPSNRARTIAMAIVMLAPAPAPELKQTSGTLSSEAAAPRPAPAPPLLQAAPVRKDVTEAPSKSLQWSVQALLVEPGGEKSLDAGGALRGSVPRPAGEDLFLLATPPNLQSARP